MYKLIRFYNQNRTKIIKTILIIVLIILVIQLLNYLTKLKIEKEKTQNSALLNNSIVNNTSTSLITDKSAVSGESVSSNKLKKDTDIIDDFIKFCNDGDINSAYLLLTEECKEVMFPSIDDFYNIYYSKVFDTYKTHTIRNWSGSTYQVKFSGDILSTGDLNNSVTNQDYITVVTKDGERKLNINGYIERIEVDKEVEVKKINIKVEKMDIYMNFVDCAFYVKNNSYRTILLDNFIDVDSMYIKDDSGVQYSAYTHELSKETLKLGVSQEKKINMKYYSKYSSTKDIDKIVFSKVVNDFERYDNLFNENQYGNYLTIEIKL